MRPSAQTAQLAWPNVVTKVQQQTAKDVPLEAL